MFYKLKRELSTFYFIYALVTYRGFNEHLAGVGAGDSRTFRVSCRAGDGVGSGSPGPKGVEKPKL